MGLLVTEYSPGRCSNSRVSVCSMFGSDLVSPLVVSGLLCLDLKSFQLFLPILAMALLTILILNSRLGKIRCLPTTSSLLEPN